MTFVHPTSFMENFAYQGPSLENGELVDRMPLPDGIPLQLVAVRDIGVIAAAALVGSSEVPAVIEIAGDARTGSEMAAAFAKHTGLPARYEALPIEVLNGNEDAQAMFRWFAETPAYQADIDHVRSIDADLWDLTTWLTNTHYTVPHPI